MKSLFAMILSCLCLGACAQSLQLHYDLRHTVDPEHTTRNFPTLYFEYFKIFDSGKAFIKPGPFLLKTQVDFTGDRSNASQLYMQLFQQFRLWQPKIFISLQYSGGLGLTNPREYSYYIFNTYSAGLNYPFKWGNAYVSAEADLKYVTYTKPSIDLSYSFYFYKGLFNYKAELSGDFSVWTQNKNHGDDATRSMRGKWLLFFGEPQLWCKLKPSLYIGTKINMFYHVLNTSQQLQVYPTAAIRIKL